MQSKAKSNSVCTAVFNREANTLTVDVLRAAVNKANIDRSERVKALKRLVEYGKAKISARSGDPDREN